MCRKVFRTSDGHIGLGHRTMREGDVRVVLQGSIYPMVLRRCGDYFELVGPALLYGFMNEEADRLRLDGKLSHQEFHIIWKIVCVLETFYERVSSAHLAAKAAYPASLPPVKWFPASWPSMLHIGASQNSE